MFSIVCIVSSIFSYGEVYLIQHYVIMFVSDLQQVSGLLWVLRFPLPIKLTSTTYILLKVTLNTITITLTQFMYYVCIMLIMYVAHQGCVVTIIRDQTTELLIMYVAHQGCVVTIIRDQTTELLIMYVAHQ